MKTEILNNKTEQSREIDWNICQIVINKSIGGTVVVLTNGKHEGYDFEGTVIASTNPQLKLYYFSKKWNKRELQPINEPLDIRFYP